MASVFLKAWSNDIRSSLTDLQKPVAKALTAAMRDCAKLAQDGGRANVAAAGFGTRFQNSVVGTAYPQRGDSLDPAAQLKSRVPYSKIFETSGDIAGPNLLWIAITGSAAAAGKRYTPAEWEFNVGPLFMLKRPGKPPLLMGYVRGRTRSIRAFGRGKNPGGRGAVQAVPLFVGVPRVHIPKKLDFQGVADRAAAMLPILYEFHAKD